MATTILLLCLFAFIAGFVDAIVGGGGLIQTPAGLILMPTEAVSTVIGSLKIPAFTGTAFAVQQYLK
ncbi:sulfite exporter TauE/SafE family protein, partial [Streptococcus suis]